MGVNVRVDVDVAETVLYLTKAEERADNMIPVWLWARRELEQANAENFAANGLPSGKAWSPLDPEYGTWKSSRFPGMPTLVRSGKLFNSLTNLRGLPNFVRRDAAAFGTNIEYAKFHQSGTFKMPKRQILFEPPLFAFRLAERMGSWIVDGEVR